MTIRFAHILLVLLLALGPAAKAQKLVLVNEEKGNTVNLWKGIEISYKASNESKKGRYMGCYDSFAFTKTDTFNIHDVSIIGIKNYDKVLLEMGANLTYYGSGLLFGLGVALYAALDDIPEAGLIIMGMAKIPMEIARHYIRKSKYKLYSMNEGWKLDVID